MTNLYDKDFRTDFKSVLDRLSKSLIKSGMITDKKEGSAARTLAETFAREMASFYAILEKAHQAGYLTTADGKSLDNVVALLGVRRADPGLLRGHVEFSRGLDADREIAIPAGSRVTGPPTMEGNPVPLMETVEQARIPCGGRVAVVAVQELSDIEQSDISSLPPGALTIMPNPLLGVEKITNPDPIVRGGRPENDDLLRVRAGAVLRQGRKGSVDAIEAAVRGMGVDTVVVVENPEGKIGCVEVRVGDPELEKDASRRKKVEEAVRMVKPAGIFMDVKFVRSVYCKLKLTVEPEDAEMGDDAFEDLAGRLKLQVKAFIDKLTAGALINKKKLDAVLMGDETIQRVKIEMAHLGNKGGEDETGRRELPSADWYIGPLEKACLDDNGVTVDKKEPLRARVDLNVTVTKTALDIDTIRTNVRAAADEYIQRLKPKEDESGQIAFREIVFNDLLDALNDKALVVELQNTHIEHLADGHVEDLNDTAPHPRLVNDERLDIIRIDVTMGKQAESIEDNHVDTV